jgi:molybdopterin-guanine dinucleotide biosynthesis adapter protein
MKVFQIVGYKNSGKTTVMCHLIRTLHAAGYKVATLKHHAHVDVDSFSGLDKGTDTGKHWTSGAIGTVLAGPESAKMNFLLAPPIEAYIAFYQHLKIDCLLIEGFKRAPYPKAVLLRSEEDVKTLNNLENIQTYIVPKEEPFTSDLFPLFYREDVTSYTTYIKNWLEGQS